jgi:Cu2+-containing amine oxidase
VVHPKSNNCPFEGGERGIETAKLVYCEGEVASLNTVLSFYESTTGSSYPHFNYNAQHHKTSKYRFLEALLNKPFS